jgi:hypothetical protein
MNWGREASKQHREKRDNWSDSKWNLTMALALAFANRLLQLIPPEGLLGKDTKKARLLIDVDLGNVIVTWWSQEKQINKSMTDY